MTINDTDKETGFGAFSTTEYANIPAANGAKANRIPENEPANMTADVDNMLYINIKDYTFI